jgi:CDP-2,3-bis-(O-geranylgeranyl)-sn-glycerol synthase
MPDPLHCGLFLIVAFVLAGFMQTLWLRSSVSQVLAIPLDGGRKFRGQPVFGANKTLRGFIVMIPSAALAFVAVATTVSLSQGTPPKTPWQMTLSSYAILGAWAGFGFMAAELPNSFVKRRFGISPGKAPTSPLTMAICLTIDRIDSILGMLISVTLAVPTSWLTWVYVLTLGPAIHGLFSWWLYRLGVKERAA